MWGEWTLLILDFVGATGLAFGFVLAMRRLRQHRISFNSSPSNHGD